MRSELFIPSGQTAKLLEAADQPFDGVALGIAPRVVGARVAALAPGRDESFRAAADPVGHERVGIVAAAGDKQARTRPARNGNACGAS